VKITIDQFKQAAWLGDFDIVRSYIEQGGDVHACASNGVSALVSSHIPILDYLLEQGANPSQIWTDGNPAICFHAWEVNLEALKWFLDKGADPNIAHVETGETCLHSLTAKPVDLKKRFQAIQILLNDGADPNLKTKVGIETGNFMRDVRVVGETPLHRAAAYQSTETIQLLIEKGADKTLRDARDESPLSWASRHWRDRETLKLLQYGSFAAKTS
jgi:uncharacterized protein